MIYDSSIDQALGSKQKAATPVRLAEVTSLSSDGRAYIQFYGEGGSSGKLYPYIDGYKPAVRDIVLVVEQGTTAIIIGKINKDALRTYYLTKSEADDTYLTLEDAEESYLTKTQAEEKYLQIANAYRLRLTSGSTTATFGFPNSSTRTYINGYADLSNRTKLNLGSPSSSSDRFAGVYCDTLGGASDGLSIQTLNVKAINNYGNMVPKTNNAYDLGSSSYNFNNLYAKTTHATDAYISSHIYFDSSHYLQYYSGSNSLSPPYAVNINLGSNVNYQFNNVWAKQFYQNGTAISTSDRRRKKEIKPLTAKAKEFFRKLKPVSFKFKDGESGRRHFGFIAQDVEEAAVDTGIDLKDLALVCIHEDGTYGLRYEELIALQTAVIQDLEKRVEALEEKERERSTK